MVAQLVADFEEFPFGTIPVVNSRRVGAFGTSGRVFEIGGKGFFAPV